MHTSHETSFDARLTDYYFLILLLTVIPVYLSALLSRTSYTRLLTSSSIKDIKMHDVEAYISHEFSHMDRLSVYSFSLYHKISALTFMSDEDSTAQCLSYV